MSDHLLYPFSGTEIPEVYGEVLAYHAHQSFVQVRRPFYLPALARYLPSGLTASVDSPP